MKTEVLPDGGAFFAGPRWRDGKLWFSDMHGRQIMTVDTDGATAGVDPDGTARVVADDLRVPTETVITDDGLTPIVGESFGGRLAAFDLEGDRSLANRPVWADIGVPPDGLRFDAEGCVWVASPTERAIVRIQEGRQLLSRVEAARGAIACIPRGPNRNALCALTAEATQPARALEFRSARIATIAVDIPGAGLPSGAGLP